MSIMVNCQAQPPFQPSNGLRQRDLLAPLCFMCRGFILIQEEIHKSNLQGNKIHDANESFSLCRRPDDNSLSKQEGIQDSQEYTQHP